MKSSRTESHRQRLEALRRVYTADLPVRIGAIAEATASLEPDDRDKLQALYHLVHRLTGSAAIYGFTRLSHAASVLEARVFSALREGAPLEPESAPSLAALVSVLRTELALATAPPPDRRRA